jgi:hypothetical protein
MLTQALSKLEKPLRLKPLPIDKPTRVHCGPHLGCGSFSNRARWTATILLTIVLASVMVTFNLFYLGLLGGSLFITAASMLCCGEQAVSVEDALKHGETPMRCSWGCNLRCSTFSTHLRWALALAVGVPTMVLFTLVLAFCIRDERHCTEDCLCSIFLGLTALPGLIPLILLATMCCCTEVPVPYSPKVCSFHLRCCIRASIHIVQAFLHRWSKERLSTLLPLSCRGYTQSRGSFTCMQ